MANSVASTVESRKHALFLHARGHHLQHPSNTTVVAASYLCGSTQHNCSRVERGLAHVSKVIQKNLGSETLLAIVDACPLLDQLQLCWPRKRVHDRAIVYAGIQGGLEQ